MDKMKRVQRLWKFVLIPLELQMLCQIILILRSSWCLVVRTAGSRSLMRHSVVRLFWNIRRKPCAYPFRRPALLSSKIIKERSNVSKPLSSLKSFKCTKRFIGIWSRWESKCIFLNMIIQQFFPFFSAIQQTILCYYRNGCFKSTTIIYFKFLFGITVCKWH